MRRFATLSRWSGLRARLGRLGAPVGFGFSRAEQECVHGPAGQKRVDDSLATWPDVDRPAVPVVGCLVAFGGVSPDGAGRVQIDRPHDHQLSGAGSGEQLQIDESGHLVNKTFFRAMNHARNGCSRRRLHNHRNIGKHEIQGIFEFWNEVLNLTRGTKFENMKLTTDQGRMD
mgnify:CR=1 FL=1